MALAFAMAGTIARADAQYSQVIIFGDDFSDQGNAFKAYGLPPSPTYYKGRYTDGPNWVDQFTAALGLTTTNSLAGGTNYAYGGAATGPLAKGMMSFQPPSIYTQIFTYLRSHTVDPKALYIVEGGIDDIGEALLNTESDPLDILLIPGTDVTAANDISVDVSLLTNSGAKTVLVPNLPNLALTPLVTEAPPGLLGLNTLLGPTLATDSAEAFNATLSTDLQPGIKSGKVILWDFWNTTQAALATAVDFGVTNTTSSCVPGFGNSATAVSTCTAAQQSSYAFWDQEHLTVLGNFGIAQGADCALGLLNALGLTQSQCVVTKSLDTTARTRLARDVNTFYHRAITRRL